MDTIYFATLTTVDNIFACNRAEAPFGCFALFFVDQMPVLCLRNLCTMLHFVDSARCCFEIQDYHIELTDIEMVGKHFLLPVSQLRFQKDDIFHHAAFDLIADSLKDSISFRKR